MRHFWKRRSRRCVKSAPIVDSVADSCYKKRNDQIKRILNFVHIKWSKTYKKLIHIYNFYIYITRHSTCRPERYWRWNSGYQSCVLHCHGTRCDNVDHVEHQHQSRFQKLYFCRSYLRFIGRCGREKWFQSDFLRKRRLPPRSPRFECSNRLGKTAELTNSAIHASMDIRLMASSYHWRSPPLCEQVTTPAAPFSQSLCNTFDLPNAPNRWLKMPCTIIHHRCKYCESFAKEEFFNFKIFLSNVLNKILYSYLLLPINSSQNICILQLIFYRRKNFILKNLISLSLISSF